MDQKIICSQCRHWQIFDEESIKRFEANTSTTKIVYDPKGVWMRPNRVNEKTEMGKAQHEFNKIVRNRKIEAEERSIRMDKNLQRLVELMEAKALVQ